MNITKPQAAHLLHLIEALAQSTLQAGAASAKSEEDFVEALKVSAECRRQMLVYLDELTEE